KGEADRLTVTTTKMPIAAKNIVRVVNFWIRKAVAGIMMPLTSMNSVVTHCAVFAVMPKSTMKAGSAVFSSVWFRMMTNAPASRTDITTYGLVAAGAGPLLLDAALSLCPKVGTSLVSIAT